MKIAQWVVIGLILASLVFGSIQVLGIRSILSEQSGKLTELQREQGKLAEDMQEMGGRLLQAIPDARQILRDVLGNGGDISAENPLPVLKQQGLVKKIMVDSDVAATPQVFIGGFNNSVQTYRYHQYVVFVDHDGAIKFAKRQVGDDYWDIYPTGIAQTIMDNHGSPHFSFDKNGRIILFYNTYGDIPRWRLSSNPEDPSRWESENTTLSGSDDKKISYPVMIRFFDESGTLLLLYREEQSTTQARYHLDRWDPDTKTWKALHHPFITSPQEKEGWSYFTETKQVDRQNRLHLFFLWRWTATGDNDDNRNINYMMTDDFGQTWKKSNGTAYSLPVTFGSAEVVDEVPVRSGLFIPDATFDENNNPVVLYARNDSSGIQQYFTAYLKDGDWVKEQISQKTWPGHLNLPKDLRWRVSPVAYRILASTEGDLYALVADAEYGDGLTLFFQKSGTLSWQKYSLVSDALIESEFQVDTWKWNFWGNGNVLDILAIKGASMFGNRGLQAEAPLYLYEFYLPLLGIGQPFETGEKLAAESHTILIKSSVAASSATALDDSSRVIPSGGSLALTVAATYHSSATRGVKVHLYTSYDGVSWDSEELKDSLDKPIFGDMPFSIGQRAQKTQDIPTNARFIKVTVENLDRTYAVSDIKVIATLR